MSKEFKILFLGDIVGRPGREIVKEFLENDKKAKSCDFVIANAENASHGFGLTLKNHDEFLQWGINCLTSGNHIWDKKDVFSYIDESSALIRPYNYPEAQGVGYRIFENGVIVINMLGRTFMPPIDCPFRALEEVVEKLKSTCDFENMISFVDFHAEATAEKICFAKYAASLGIKAVVGTHTHVQTSDEKIIDSKCAYLTDAGFCGSSEGVIGMDYQNSLKRLLSAIPARFDVDESNYSQINACIISFDKKTGIAKKIERINFISEVKK